MLIVGASEKKHILKLRQKSKILICELNTKKIINQINLNTQIFDIIKSPI